MTSVTSATAALSSVIFTCNNVTACRNESDLTHCHELVLKVSFTHQSITNKQQNGLTQKKE